MKEFDKFIEEAAAKRCPTGQYYCFTDKKCKKIPMGYYIGRRGYLEPDKDDDSNGKKNGNGGNGNGVEVGHMLADKDSVYEDYISKRALVAYALDKLEKSDKYEDSVLAKIPADELTAKDIEAALKEKDKLAKKVFSHFGKWLGKNLVSAIRVLDISTILLGGGVSKTLKYMEAPMMEEINKYLDPYYTSDLVIQKASLKNEAGIIGAASLNF